MVNKGCYQQRVHWWLIFRIVVGNKMTRLVLITHADLLIKGITGIKQIKGIADLGYIIMKYIAFNYNYIGILFITITITINFIYKCNQFNNN